MPDARERSMAVRMRSSCSKELYVGLMSSWSEAMNDDVHGHGLNLRTTLKNSLENMNRLCSSGDGEVCFLEITSVSLKAIGIGCTLAFTDAWDTRSMYLVYLCYI